MGRSYFLENSAYEKLLWPEDPSFQEGVSWLRTKNEELVRNSLESVCLPAFIALILYMA